MNLISISIVEIGDIFVLKRFSHHIFCHVTCIGV